MTVTLFGDDYDARLRSALGSAILRHYKLNETSGTTVFDYSPAAQNLTAVGFSFAATPSPFGDPAPQLDGVNDYAGVGAALTSAPAFSGDEFSALIWYKVSGASVWSDATQRWLLRLYVDASNEVFIRKGSGANTIETRRVASGTTVNGPTYSSGGRLDWFSILLTCSRSGGRLAVYVDGTQVSTTQAIATSFVGSLFSTSSNLGAANQPGNVTDGYISRFVVFNRELTAAEAVIAGRR